MIYPFEQHKKSFLY